MALPARNADGLLPPGRHEATLAEIKVAFVDAFPGSSTRPQVWERFLRFRTALLGVIPVEAQWINGSFVTGVVDPNDVDVVSVVQAGAMNALDIQTRQAVGPLIAGHATLATWGCDSFLIASYPGTHENFPKYLERRAYWDGWWSKVNPKHEQYSDPRFLTLSKGYVEIR